MDELLASLKNVIDERLSNPLTSSFVLSWSAWNYKFFVILFSDNSVTATFDLINKICFPSVWHYVFFGFIFPFSSALVYIFWYPKLARWVYEHWLQRQRSYLETKYRVEDAQLLSAEEGRQIRMENRSLNQRLKERDEEIRRMEEDFSAQMERNAVKSHVDEDKADEVTVNGEPVVVSSSETLVPQDEVAILDLFSGGAPEFDLPRMATILKLPYAVVKYRAQELVAKRLLAVSIRGNYSLTHEGTGYLLDRGMFSYQKQK